MKSIVKKLEGLLVTYHCHVSTAVLALATVVSLGIITPTLLYAQEFIMTPESAIQPVIQATPIEVLQPIQPVEQVIEEEQKFPDAIMPGTESKLEMEKPQENNFETKPHFDGGDDAMRNFNPPPMRPGKDGSFENNGENNAKREAQEQAREAQQLKMIKRQISGLEKGFTQFKRQLARLTKQKISLPSDLSETVAKLEAAFTTAKSAATFDDAQSQMEDISDGMHSLMEARETLEKLARWPQTIKNVDRVLKTLDRQLGQDQKIADRLAKKGFDLTDKISSLKENTAKLHAVRDAAIATVATDADVAFESIENDFYGELDGVMSDHKVIQQLSNVSRITSESKRAVSEAERTIRKLKDAKEDTSEMEAKLAELKETVTAINRTISQKPIDTEALEVALSGLEDLRQEFGEARGEFGGQALPWTSGPDQFNFKVLNTGQSVMPNGGQLGPVQQF